MVLHRPAPPKVGMGVAQATDDAGLEREGRTFGSPK
jgi:hypothetical protein